MSVETRGQPDAGWLAATITSKVSIRSLKWRALDNNLVQVIGNPITDIPIFLK